MAWFVSNCSEALIGAVCTYAILQGLFGYARAEALGRSTVEMGFLSNARHNDFSRANRLTWTSSVKSSEISCWTTGVLAK
jgi:hypothetical protein